MLNSCSAKFHIDGMSRDFDVIECEYEFSQSVDQTGKPSSRASGGIIHVVLENAEDTSPIANWMFNEFEKKSGNITFTLSDEKTKKIVFTEGVCVSYHELFNMRDVNIETNKPSMLLKLSITANTIMIGTAMYSNNWKSIV